MVEFSYFRHRTLIARSFQTFSSFLDRMFKVPKRIYNMYTSTVNYGDFEREMSSVWQVRPSAICFPLARRF